LQQIRDLHHPVFSAKGRAPILEIGFRALSIFPPLTDNEGANQIY
jgi:hypothetical protein